MLNWIEKGGLIMKFLLLMNAIGWGLMLWRAISLWLFNSKIDSHIEKFLEFFKSVKLSEFSLSAAEKLEITLSHYMEPFTRGMNAIRIIASISPLLGLLGTVLGILTSFSVIAQKGLDNPGLFAEGISLALVTTVGGLLVAIPHFVGHNLLKGYLGRVEKRLERKLIFN